jgi:hypothetical protein
VTGCASRSSVACRAWRCMPSAGRPPYSASATSGWPRCARCTRIWCVRPVCSVQLHALKPSGTGHAAHVGARWRGPTGHHGHAHAHLRVAADGRVDGKDIRLWARRAPAPGSGGAPRAPRWRAPAPSRPAASCRPSSRPRCPCPAGARCPRAAAWRSAAWWASRPLSSVPCQLPGAGVHHQAGRLVQHQQVLVLVQHLQRHRLRRKARLSSVGTSSTCTAGRPQRACEVTLHHAVHAHVALLDQALQVAARELRAPGHQHLVQPLAVLRRGRDAADWRVSTSVSALRPGRLGPIGLPASSAGAARGRLPIIRLSPIPLGRHPTR